jgi:DNA-binding beta-propeller fold protein YncE
MRRVFFIGKLAAVICAFTGVTSVAATAPAGYHVARTIFIGGAGAWDYTTVDAEHRRLYVSHGMQVEVIDLTSGKVAGTITGTFGARGIAVVPELGRGFIACNKTNSVLIFDLATLAPIGSVKTDEKPDAIAYDDTSGLVLAFTHNKSATVFRAKDGIVTGKIALGGGPEFAVSDGKGKVYVSLQDTNEVAQLDPLKLRLDTRWAVQSCDAATSLGIDRQSRRLFVGCHNRTLAILDANSGKTLQTLPIGPGVDGTVYDDKTQLVFVSSGGDGTTTIIHEDDPNHFSVVDVVRTQLSARTIALDPATHSVYLPFAKAVATPLKKGQEEQFEEGTFGVLVVSR